MTRVAESSVLATQCRRGRRALERVVQEERYSEKRHGTAVDLRGEPLHSQPEALIVLLVEGGSGPPESLPPRQGPGDVVEVVPDCGVAPVRAAEVAHDALELTQVSGPVVVQQQRH